MQNIYTGFHAVEEKIKRSSNHSTALALSIVYSKAGPRVKKILALAKEAGIPCTQSSKEELDRLVCALPLELQDHRGIVLVAEGEATDPFTAVDLETWLKTCPQRATVLILDSVTDPHNIGAVLRSCDQFGVSLLILPERRTTVNIQENQIIARASAGAASYVTVARVANIVRATEKLKASGFWVYGAESSGEQLTNTQFDAKTCLIMGSEGSGISRLLREACDSYVAIPTCGKIDSLNVSVATGILLYERYKQGLAK